MELRQRRINTAVFALLGALAGYISFLLNSPLLSLAAAVVVLAIAAFAVQKFFRITDKKWWASPATLYIFAWIVVWTVFFNIYIVHAPV